MRKSGERNTFVFEYLQIWSLIGGSHYSLTPPWPNCVSDPSFLLHLSQMTVVRRAEK
jgi:hypothetical protein